MLHSDQALVWMVLLEEKCLVTPEIIQFFGLLQNFLIHFSLFTFGNDWNVEVVSFGRANLSHARVTWRLTNQKPVLWERKCKKVSLKFFIELKIWLKEIFFLGKSIQFCNERNKKLFKKWRKLNLKVLNEKFSCLKRKQMCTVVYLPLK